jgi:hypothetical protein
VKPRPPVPIREGAPHGYPVVLLAALILAPLGAQAADLVVWWEKAFYPQSDAAVAEIVAAFEHESGKQVELVQPTQDEILEPLLPRWVHIFVAFGDESSIGISVL